MTVTTEAVSQPTSPQTTPSSPPRPVTSRRRKKRLLGPTLRTIGIVGVVLLFILPLGWMLMAAFKTNLDIVSPASTFDFTPTMSNFETVFGEQNFLPFILNSIIVGIGATVIALILGVPAAYGIARYKIRNATAFVLLARVIPGVSLLIPWYFLFSQVQLVGTYTALILTHIFVTMPLVVAIMAGFFEGLPEELEEAAQIDGSSRVGAFVRVVLPLALPGVATSAILAFIFSWNNFLFALVLSNQETRTLPVAISNFTSYASVDWGGLMAASVIITIPVMLVALFAQKYVVAGLTAGATKG